MKRLLLVALTLAGVCWGRGFEPNEVEISLHRKEVYLLARDYVVETFNLEVEDEGNFNPVRFNSNGVWGNFEARIKELGGDRYEVQGWVRAKGHHRARIRWAVHLRYALPDPEAWRYRKIGDTAADEPEFLGWTFGDYRSIGYEANYEPDFLARTFGE